MNEKQVLSALGILTNGALNYYQATQTVMVKDNLIRNYIELLQKQNTELKEENFKLQARSDRVINNWNKLKEWLEDYKKQCDYEIKKGIALHTYDEIDRNRRYGDITHCLENTLKQMQEIEGEMNE